MGKGEVDSRSSPPTSSYDAAIHPERLTQSIPKNVYDKSTKHAKKWTYYEKKTGSFFLLSPNQVGG